MSMCIAPSSGQPLHIYEITKDIPQVQLLYIHINNNNN